MTQGPETIRARRSPASRASSASTTFRAPVVRRAEDLLLDWLGSALAGKGARPVEAIERFAGGWGRPRARRRC